MSAVKKLLNSQSLDALVPGGASQNVDWSQLCIFDSAEPTDILNEAITSGTPHVIQNTHPHFIKDLSTSVLMLTEPDALIKAPLTTILSAYSDPAVTEPALTIFDQSFNASKQKSGLLASINDILSKRTISQSIRGDILVIADELVTNAIFNAPFVDFENTLPGAPRDGTEVAMHEGKSARVWLGIDDKRVVIGCKDEYGTLNFQKFLRRVKNCYDTGVAATMRMSSEGGAGIGSFMIFNSSANFYADIKPGSHSAIFCALPLNLSSRARAAMPKNLHFKIHKKD